MKEFVNIGIIGLSGRGSGMLGELLDCEGVRVPAVCDKYEDRAQRMAFKLAGMLSRHFSSGSVRRTALDASPVTGPYAPVVDKVADEYIRTIRVSLKKDRYLRSHKNVLREMIATFEKAEKYTGHISIDVDPA